MTLSYCTNWVAMDPLVPDISLLQHQQQQEPDLIDLPINFNDDVLFNDINEYFSMDADSCSVLPPSDEHFTSFSDPSVLSLPHEPNPVPQPYVDDVSFYHHQPYSKRSRSLDSLCHSSSLFGNVDPLVQTIHGFNCATPDCLPRFVFPPSRVELGRQPVVEYRTGHNDGNEKKVNGCLSAQSMAARERRKRISDKTQELGRLIPGGNKMNTAEMFQAAAHYVKFLHAQVGILALMARPSQESSLPAEEELRLHRLLTSSSVHERLYRAERCIVPKRMVEDLGKDRAVRSHPSISRDLGRFLESTKDEKPPLRNKAS